MQQRENKGFSFSLPVIFPLIYLKENVRVREYICVCQTINAQYSALCVCMWGGGLLLRVMRRNLIYDQHERSTKTISHTRTHSHLRTQAHFIERFKSIFHSHVYQIPRK